MSIGLQSFSPNRQVRYSVLNDLNFDRIAELTPGKSKLTNMMWTKESTLCKFRKKYRLNKLTEVCQLDSNALVQSLSSALNLDTSGFLASIIRSRVFCLWSLFPLPLRRTLKSLSSTVQLRTSIYSHTHVLSIIEDIVLTMSDKYCMYCLMFNEMSIREHLRFNH